MQAMMELQTGHPPKPKLGRRVQPASAAPAPQTRLKGPPDARRLEVAVWGDATLKGASTHSPARPAPKSQGVEPHAIEPLRRRRIVRERDAIGARLDLHGLDQDRARGALHAFLIRAHAQGHRAVLVITGKGALGDGILRRRAPEWLTEPAVRPLVAGVSQADRRHGGAGALYIALKRRQA